MVGVVYQKLPCLGALRAFLHVAPFLSLPCLVASFHFVDFSKHAHTQRAALILLCSTCFS
jgi:hypothetical protein